MSEQLTQLQQLQAELHEINEGLQKVAEPLRRPDELSLEERRELSHEIRAWLKRWESVTRQISLALGTGSAKGA
jgi:hypothetical protein